MTAIRVGDAERAQAVAQLEQHAAAGRLDPSELAERRSRAQHATYDTDLDALFADLPGGRVKQEFHWQQPSSGPSGVSDGPDDRTRTTYAEPVTGPVVTGPVETGPYDSEESLYGGRVRGSSYQSKTVWSGDTEIREVRINGRRVEREIRSTRPRGWQVATPILAFVAFVVLANYLHFWPAFFLWFFIFPALSRWGRNRDR